MKRAILLVLAAAVLGAFGAASATNAAYDIKTSSAKSMKGSFVPAYNQCVGGGLTHRPGFAHPACAPTPSTNAGAKKVSLGPKGKATFSLGVSKGDVKIQGAGSPVLVNGAPAGSGDTFKGSSEVRGTDNGCGVSPYNDDCTQEDFPFDVDIGCDFGKCSVKTTANTVQHTGADGALHEGDLANVEILQLKLLDADGDQAGTQGLFVP